MREGRRLSHANVVQIHDAGTFDKRVFLAMEFIRGVDLRRWLGSARRTEAEVMSVFAAAGRGLSAAHAQGLVLDGGLDLLESAVGGCRLPGRLAFARRRAPRSRTAARAGGT